MGVARITDYAQGTLQERDQVPITKNAKKLAPGAAKYPAGSARRKAAKRKAADRVRGR